GVGNSDMQQGDRQRLEAAQKVAPRPKKQNSGAAAQPAPQRQAGRAAPNVEVPDAIDFIGGRAKGTLGDAPIGQGAPYVNVEAWKPLLQELVRDPNLSGPLSTAIIEQLGNLNRQRNTVGVDVIDMNAATDALELGLS
ncbi:unnamed protein product, partial [marine sediment metagenome]